MAGACDLIATTAPGSASSVTFSGISQDYKHLEIAIVEQRSASSGSNYFWLRFNGVTSASYCHNMFARGGGSSGGSLGAAAVSQSYGGLGWADNGAWKPGKRVIYIPNYTDTGFNKMAFSWYVTSDGGSTSYGSGGLGSCQIETNDAVTSVTLSKVTSGAWDSDVTQFNLIGWGT